MRELPRLEPGAPFAVLARAHFPDYTNDELVAITHRSRAENEYRFDEGAEGEVRGSSTGQRGEGFGNARFSRTLFEQALNAQALRLAGVSGARLERLEQSELTSLIGEDFGAAARALAEGAEVSPSRRRLWRRASPEGAKPNSVAA